MSQIKTLPVEDLTLDLHNYRAVPQKNEIASIHALISINPAYFWALAHSLVEDAWHGTENVVVLKRIEKKGEVFVVKEGNRRIGALKLILGGIPAANFSIPSDLEEKISKRSAAWKKATSIVPCIVFGPTEEAQAERLVGITHGKGEKAGRLEWNAVARARYNRDKSGGAEPALDLLEKYLNAGKNLTPTQKERWGGEYPLSVLAETVKRLSSRFQLSESKEVIALYPKEIKYRNSFESVLHDIGVDTFGFPQLRDLAEDFGAAYGFPPLPAAPATNAAAAATTGTQGPGANSATQAKGSSPSGPASTSSNPKALPANDPRSVTRALKKFNPKGQGREKLVRLLIEARSLKISKHPHAFCFLLRSMFELSAKCYCDDQKANGGPSPHKADGSDKFLAELLKDINKHLTSSGTNKQVTKELHGATAELAKSEGFLSVTSMNQLIHNKKFSVDETHISTLFHNILPLLEAMNR